MLDYTKAAITKMVDDFKRFVYVFQVCTYIVYAIYLVYALASKAGIWFVNAVLLVLTLSYLVFFIVYHRRERQNKQLKNVVKKIFKWSKRGIKIFTIAVAMYGLYQTTQHITPLSVIFSALMIVGFVLDILFEVIIRFVVNKAKFLYEGLQADFESITKPVKSVGNFFKKMTGREVEEEENEPTKNRLKLDELVAIARAEKQQKKQAEKLARIENKNNAKLLKKQEKQKLKEEKRQKKQTQQIPAPTKEITEE